MIDVLLQGTCALPAIQLQFIAIRTVANKASWQIMAIVFTVIWHFYAFIHIYSNQNEFMPLKTIHITSINDYVQGEVFILNN